jgi:hypothetical protein
MATWYLYQPPTTLPVESLYVGGLTNTFNSVASVSSLVLDANQLGRKESGIRPSGRREHENLVWPSRWRGPCSVGERLLTLVNTPCTFETPDEGFRDNISVKRLPIFV